MAAAVAGWPRRRAAAQVCPRVADCVRARPLPWRAPPQAYACVPPLQFLRHDSLHFPVSLAPLPAGHPVASTASSLSLSRRAAPMARAAYRTAPEARARSRLVACTLLICPYEERQQDREPFADTHGTRRILAARQPRHLSHLLMHLARPPVPMQHPSPALSRTADPSLFASRPPHALPSYLCTRCQQVS